MDFEKSTLKELKNYARKNNIKKITGLKKADLINHIENYVAVETPKKIYCGIKPLKKNQRHGTMQECLDLKKVNRYGMYAVESHAIEEYLAMLDSQSSKKNQRTTLLVRLAGITGKISKLKKDLPYMKNKEDKQELEKVIEELKLEKKDINNKLDIIENKKQEPVLEPVNKKPKIDSLKKDMQEFLKQNKSKKIKSIEEYNLPSIPNKKVKSKKIIDYNLIQEDLDNNLDRLKERATEAYMEDNRLDLSTFDYDDAYTEGLSDYEQEEIDNFLKTKYGITQSELNNLNVVEKKKKAKSKKNNNYLDRMKLFM